MKLNNHPSFLQALFLVIILILFCLIIYTPTFIIGLVHITNKMIIREETIEGTLLGLFLIVCILILYLYKREVIIQERIIHKINNDKPKVENRLSISDEYIGMANVHIQELNSIYDNIDNYPKLKAELKKTFSYYGIKILKIIHSDWALIRIINCNTHCTIFENINTKDKLQINYPNISNKTIIEDNHLSSYTSVIYNPKNLNILVLCVLPVDKISNDERIVVQSLVDELTKLYVIINSIYFKVDKKICSDEKADNN